MAKFEVLIIEKATYRCEVNSRSAAEAERKAEKLFLSAKGIKIGPPFSVQIDHREAYAQKL